MILSSQYLVQTVWFQLREWRKNGLEVLKLNISKGPVSRPPLSGSDCLNLVLDFGTTLECQRSGENTGTEEGFKQRTKPSLIGQTGGDHDQKQVDGYGVQ